MKKTKYVQNRFSAKKTHKLLQYGMELSDDLSFGKRMILCFCICVLKVSILPLSTILIFDFGIVPTVFVFHFKSIIIFD